VSDHRAIHHRARKPQAETQAKGRVEALLVSAVRWDDPTITASLSALSAIAATCITFACSHRDESPARHHSRRACRNSDRHHHHHEAMTHAQYAQASSCVKPTA
jgi:hypothetical protein